MTRSLIDQAVELGGPGCIELLLVDALYADGPLLAWLKYRHEIDALVPIPSDREIHRDLQGLAGAGMLEFRCHSYVRAIQGHKQRRTLDNTMMSISLCLLFGSSLLGSGRSSKCSTIERRSLHRSLPHRSGGNSRLLAISCPPWLETQTVKGVDYQETLLPETPASLL